MGYKPKKDWTPTDRTKAGDVSVSELQQKLASDQEAANKWAVSTWNKSNTLTASEIATLDGKGNAYRYSNVNAIGTPFQIESGNKPAGFSSGVVGGESPQGGN
jgi:hypothetical protein